MGLYPQPHIYLVDKGESFTKPGLFLVSKPPEDSSSSLCRRSFLRMVFCARFLALIGELFPPPAHL